MGIDNVWIEIDSFEIFLLDGLVKVWIEVIVFIGLVKVKGVDEEVGKWRDEIIEINNIYF